MFSDLWWVIILILICYGVTSTDIFTPRASQEAYLGQDPPLTISTNDFTGSEDSNAVLMVFPGSEFHLIVLGIKLYFNVSVFVRGLR